VSDKHSAIDRILKDLKQVYLTPQAVPLDQQWTARVMRDVRRASPEEEPEITLIWRFAWTGTLCSLVLAAWVLLHGANIDDQLENLYLQRVSGDTVFAEQVTPL